MSQKQVLEVSVHLVFCKMLLYKHLHQVVHDLDEASHLFFIEMLLDSEVSVNICELLKNTKLVLAHHFSKLGSYQPG